MIYHIAFDQNLDISLIHFQSYLHQQCNVWNIQQAEKATESTSVQSQQSEKVGAVQLTGVATQTGSCLNIDPGV